NSFPTFFSAKPWPGISRWEFSAPSLLFIPGDSAQKPILSPPLRRASSPSGISCSCSRRSSLSLPRSCLSTERSWASCFSVWPEPSGFCFRSLTTERAVLAGRLFSAPESSLSAISWPCPFMDMSPSNARFRWLFLLPAILWLAGPVCAQVVNNCVVCHSALDPPYKVTEEQFAHDIHSQKGLTCAACHGGDPTKADMDAMSKSAGFRGKITRSQIPSLCGGCHGDAAFMRKYNPSLRTDQLSQYVTSVHGKLLAKGDTKVAVCIDCHGVHDLRAVNDAQSSVYPLNIAKTCSRCHADAEYMKSYSIPTDQFAKYNTSVHHDALAVRGDLSAPTCTTCHGNHGAAPPGVSTVQNVCSNCHVFQAQLYEKSPHRKAFQDAGLPGCVTCHGNHGVLHPTDENIGAGP